MLESIEFNQNDNSICKLKLYSANFTLHNNKQIGPGVYLAIVNTDFRSFFLFPPSGIPMKLIFMGPHILTQLEGICKK